ncbi:response regulator transcription factor [Streptomyces sp. NBC_00859]|uniref:response regulator transcription factor n=1 Tax=Streptomyces sp. NBC_00859 TaxID=2903682 RepID=UPI00386CDAA4|nr:LuxR C-terminal-related transcriptional regulator [Streptomyces sp. NBC_00859]
MPHVAPTNGSAGQHLPGTGTGGPPGSRPAAPYAHGSRVTGPYAPSPHAPRGSVPEPRTPGRAPGDLGSSPRSAMAPATGLLGTGPRRPPRPAGPTTAAIAAAGPVPSARGVWQAPAQSDEPPRVLLLDGDPVSRQVFGGTLNGDDQVSLVATGDSRQPLAEWPLHRADLTILVSGPLENHVLKAQDVARRGGRALLVGVDWTKHRLDAALSSGVSGCLSKDWALCHLPQAAAAAATGHVVLSPDLVGLCVSMQPVDAGRGLAHRLRCLTRREREVLTLLAEGMSTSEVSDTLVVSQATIKSHVSHALTKLCVRNRLEAVLLMQAALGCGVQHGDFRPGEI